MCLMVLKPSPVCHVLAGLVLRFPMSAPSVCPPCPCPQSLQPSSETPTARKGAQMPPAPCTDRQQGSPATFDKVEVRVHFIRSIDGNVEL